MDRARVLPGRRTDWLMRLPGFDGLRVPARFWMMALVCLSVVAALAREPAVGTRAADRRRDGGRGGLLLDGWPRTFMVAARTGDPRRRRPACRAAARPARWDPTPMRRRSTSRCSIRCPLYNGFSGYFAPHYYALRDAAGGERPADPAGARRRGPLGVVIDHAGDADGALRRFVLAYPGAPRLSTERDWSSYRLPQSAGVPRHSGPDRHADPHQVAQHVPESTPCGTRARRRSASRDGAAACSRSSPKPPSSSSRLSHVGQVVIDLGGFIDGFPEAPSDRRLGRRRGLGDRVDRRFRRSMPTIGALRHPREMPLVLRAESRRRPASSDCVRPASARTTGASPSCQVLQ